jgi:signal transduction histidine kinase
MLEGMARKEALEREMVTAERLAAVGRVSAAIAHEINNPLGGMLNAVDTLDKHGQPDALTRKTLGLLERGLQQIRATVSALLIEARLDSPALAPSDWQDLRTLIAPQVNARGLRLRWSIYRDEVLPLPAHQVRQLALNLLLNAAEAADAGGIVELEVTRNGDLLILMVANTGPPIPAELMDRLFEPFITIDDTPTAPRSYGLGLWICYQIMSQLGGSISAESADGWTRFTVTLTLQHCSQLASNTIN